MKYLKWLHEIGCKYEKSGVTEAEAIRKSVPLVDPGSLPMKSIKRVVIHHSATETGNAAYFRVLHRIVNKWNDIGYHYVIGNGTLSGDGEIEVGRSLPFTGAHARGGNEDSIGICLVGNFNNTDPTAPQLGSLSTLLQELTVKYAIKKEFVVLHRNISGSFTECPGKNLTIENVLYLLDNK